MDRIKQLTIGILDTFESLLDEYNINIPDEFREGDESEARLYGDNYYRLEDLIYNMIKEEFIICPIEFITQKEANNYEITNQN